MPRARRLHLDNVVTSMAELGPTLPDGGYSWIIFFGILLIQVTIPSILASYGVILSYLHTATETDTGIWKGSFTLTPILFIAFWSLADPWSRTIVSLATVPRLVGLIGVSLLCIGILASGYLSTGGVGAYLARLSAGGVMGIGASLVILQSENLLRRHFRTRLTFVLALKRVAFSLGISLVPGYTYLLLTQAGLQTGLLLLATVLLPAMLGACTFVPPVFQRSTPYSLLIAEEDNELNIPDVTTNRSNFEEQNTGASSAYEESDLTRDGPPPLFSEAGNNSYAFDDPEDDVNIFVTPLRSVGTSWSEEFQILRLIKFWSAVVAWFAIASCSFSLFALSPTLALTRGLDSPTLGQSITLLPAAGFGAFVPAVLSFWSPHTARLRSFYFGSMCWLGAIALWGIVSSDRLGSFLVWSFFGGVSVSGCAIGQESALRDLLGATSANRAHTALSMIVGFTLFLLTLIQDFSTYLQVVAITEIVGGSYWILTPLFGAIKARWSVR